MSEQVLIIEDEVSIFTVLQGAIAELGLELVQETDGQAGLDRALNDDFALVIVDCNLPKKNGFDVCRALRDRKPTLAIIMLTSRTDEVDKILGIELGADDYVTKPFSVREFTARVKGLLRKNNNYNAEFERKTAVNAQQGTVEQSELVFGGLKIDKAKLIVTQSGKRLDLTANEYKLLLLFASNPEQVFSRDELMEKIWGFDAKNFEPTVTVTISRLRTKIEPDITAPRFIETVRGLGYRFIGNRLNQQKQSPR